GEVLVEPQRPRQRPRDLRHLDRMGEARAIVVELLGEEHLGLVLQPAKGGRMDDAVAVALEGRARRALRLRYQAPPACSRIRGIGRPRCIAKSYRDRIHARPNLLPVPPIDFTPGASYLFGEDEDKVASP